jgi:hypothetical protein
MVQITDHANSYASKNHPESLVSPTSIIENPRIDRSKTRLLIDILLIAICAMLCERAALWILRSLGGEEGFSETLPGAARGASNHDSSTPGIRPA